MANKEQKGKKANTKKEPKYKNIKEKRRAKEAEKDKK